MGSKPQMKSLRPTDICLKCLMHVTGAVNNKGIYHNQQGNNPGTPKHA